MVAGEVIERDERNFSQMERDRERDRDTGKDRDRDKDRDRKHKDRKKDRDGEDEEERRRRKKRHREKKRLREEAESAHLAVGKGDEEGEIVQSEAVEEKEDRSERSLVLEPGEIDVALQKPGLACDVPNGVTRVFSSSQVNVFDAVKEKKSPSHSRSREEKPLTHDLDSPDTGMQMLLSAYGERGAGKDAEKRRQELVEKEERCRKDADRGHGHQSRERRAERGGSAAARTSERGEERQRHHSRDRSSRKTETGSPDRRSIRSKSRESLRSRGRSPEGRPHSRDGTLEQRRHRSRSRDSVLEPPPPPPRRRDSSIDRLRDSSPARRGSREPSYRRGDKERQADYRGSREDYRSRRSESRSRREDSRAPSTRVDPEEELRRKVEEEQKRKKEEEEFKARVARQLEEQQEAEVDPEKVLEESRKRREAILAKYRQQKAEQGASQAPAGEKSRFAPSQAVDSGAAGTANGASVAEATGLPPHAASQPAVPVAAMTGSAPDTRMTDAETSTPANENGHRHGSGQMDAVSYQETASDVGKVQEGGDMFSDDMFGDTPVTGRKLVTANGAMVDAGLVDNWDDPDGYYTFRIGEVLDKRYEVLSSHGRGVFSSVVRARDRLAKAGEPQEVAIKIIRNNETMFKAGQQELVILRKLSGADPENRRHCVRLLTSFEYRDHLCLVFESLNMNLREVLKKFGRNIGLNLSAVRAYAQQLFIALKHLKNCGVLHADIKPDNMLVNEQKNLLKLCDFGSAMFNGDNEITPYLVSRFYRSPEVILGLTYDHAMDMWSIGCCLYELYTGKILFPGNSNNEMLKLMMELKGPFPKKMLKKAAFAERHFDQDFTFGVIEEDPVTRKSIKRIMTNLKGKDLGVLLQSSARGSEDKALLTNFKDLLERVLTLDPEKRLDVSAALKHPFISGK